MATALKRRTASVLPPATGTCRWLEEVDPATGNRWLQITVYTESGKVVMQDYEVEWLKDGFRLHTLDPLTFCVKSYTISTSFGGGVWRCNCPDATYRPERAICCKHVRALKAAIVRLPF